MDITIEKKVKDESDEGRDTHKSFVTFLHLTAKCRLYAISCLKNDQSDDDFCDRCEKIGPEILLPPPGSDTLKVSLMTL